MKGFVIYLPSQKTELAHFLAQADGCNYTPIVSVSSELVSQFGGETVFICQKLKRFYIEKSRWMKSLIHFHILNVGGK